MAQGNFSRGSFHAARHSVLDELTFNRDFDQSKTSASHNKSLRPWTFQPGYSGFQSLALQYRPNRSEQRLPVSMMDCTLGSNAGTPGIVAQSSQLKDSYQIKQNPPLRGFVTEKLTSQPFTPGLRPDVSFARLNMHKELRSHEHDLIINMNTPNQYPPNPMTPMFRPLGSVMPNVQPPGRPFTTHQPGRHRNFISDITPKIK